MDAKPDPWDIPQRTAAVARIIGCTDRWLRDWIAGRGSCTPAMPHATDAKNRAILAPRSAHAHIARYARRRPKTLIDPPAPGAALPAPVARVEALADTHLGTGTAGTGTAGMSPEQHKMLMAEQSLELRRMQVEARLANMYTADQVAKLLRAVPELFVAACDDQAQADAAEIVRVVRLEIGADLPEIHSAAQDIIESVLRQRMQHKLDAIKQHVQVQVELARARSNASNASNATDQECDAND